MKIKGIKKAVGTFNNFIGHARIMYNKESLKVWTDLFASCNEWNVYHNKDIIVVKSKGIYSMSTNWNKTSMKEIKDILENV